MNGNERIKSKKNSKIKKTKSSFPYSHINYQNTKNSTLLLLLLLLMMMMMIIDRPVRFLATAIGQERAPQELRCCLLPCKDSITVFAFLRAASRLARGIERKETDERKSQKLFSRRREPRLETRRMRRKKLRFLRGLDEWWMESGPSSPLPWISL
jgi:hypothetical protein